MDKVMLLDFVELAYPRIFEVTGNYYGHKVSRNLVGKIAFATTLQGICQL